MTTIPVLGIPVRFAWNHARIGGIVERAFGAWRCIDGRPDLLDAEGVDVRIDVVAGDEGGHTVPPLDFSSPAPSRVRVRTPGSLGEADAERRSVNARVTSTLLDAEQHFRYGVLEALTLALLTRLDRQPFHAAGLVRDGYTLLLSGPSGAGKSTLSYTAIRNGYHLLAEDAVYVQSSPPRVWGLPGFIHLPPSARDHFDELRAAEPVRLANGKWKIALPLPAHALPELPVVERARVVLLERGSGGPRIERLPRAGLERVLFQRIEQGFDVFADTIRVAMAPFIARGGWRLVLGGGPEACVRLLERSTVDG